MEKLYGGKRNEIRWFQKALDECFLPDDEIFPHASGSAVTFHHIYHEQTCVTVEKAENGIISGLTVIDVHPTGKPLEGDIE